jgi:hypothetical protein
MVLPMVCDMFSRLTCPQTHPGWAAVRVALVVLARTHDLSSIFIPPRAPRSATQYAAVRASAFWYPRYQLLLFLHGGVRGAGAAMLHRAGRCTVTTVHRVNELR